MSTYDTFCDIFRARLTSYLDDMDLGNRHEIESLLNDLTQRIELIKMAMRRDALMLERRVKKLTMIQKAIQNEELDKLEDIEFASLGYSYDKY